VWNVQFDTSEDFLSRASAGRCSILRHTEHLRGDLALVQCAARTDHPSPAPAIALGRAAGELRERGVVSASEKPG
jgi:hypothetical protein